jgi:C-1 hydroxylase
MSLEENKAIVRRLWEAENERNLALLDELIAPDYVDNAFQFTGLEEYKQMQIMSIDAFPDFHETIEDIVAEGDKVCVHFKVTGTHTGEYRGFPLPSGKRITLAPTGKKFTITASLIFRIVDGKIAEKTSAVYDWMDFYKQLGIIEYTEKAKNLFPEDSS